MSKVAGYRNGLIFVLLVVSGGAAAAQENSGLEDIPQVFRDVLDCRGIPDAARRLECYDRQVGALAAAKAGEEIIVADRTQVREARRGLFGLSLPNVRIFGGADDEVDEIESTIASISKGRDGKVVFALPDGAVWRQTDTVALWRSIEPGTPVIIKKGSLGSYLAKIGRERYIKVLRDR